MSSVLDRFLTAGPAPANDATPATVATSAADADLYGFTISQLKSLAHPSEWAEVGHRPEVLSVFARSLRESRQIEAGERPDRFDGVATCRWCGPVWVPAHLDGQIVLGCRWCGPRSRGLPIPKPPREGVT